MPFFTLKQKLHCVTCRSKLTKNHLALSSLTGLQNKNSVGRRHVVSLELPNETSSSFERTSFACSGNRNRTKNESETRRKMNSLLLVFFIIPCGKLKVFVHIDYIHCLLRYLCKPCFYYTLFNDELNLHCPL